MVHINVEHFEMYLYVYIAFILEMKRNKTVSKKFEIEQVFNVTLFGGTEFPGTLLLLISYVVSIFFNFLEVGLFFV